MLKRLLAIVFLIVLATGCYTVSEHPVVKGVVDGKYHARSVNFDDDCAECHATSEIEEFDLMPLYTPEKTYGEMNFYSDSLSNIALFYGEIGWWYRYTPMVGVGAGYTSESYDDSDGYFVPNRGGGGYAPAVPLPATPVHSSGSTGTTTKERTSTTNTGDGSNSSTTRSSADRPNDPGSSRNNNNGRKSGSRK